MIANNSRSRTASTPKSLDEADTSTSRPAKKAEAAFKVFPESIPTFDRFAPVHGCYEIFRPSIIQMPNPLRKL
jgi:hypothetical protein